MKTETFADLNETFNVSAEIVPKAIQSEITDIIAKNQTKDIITTKKTDVQKDYEYSRGNLYSLIEKGQEAISGILELAQESEMPRAYEVAGQLIKNVSEATEKLMDLQKKLKSIEEESFQKMPTTVNNALFIGSTAELQKLLKSKEDINNQ
jgi:predicted house-cleaning noncanonical NTP pyrophosphatase (MazG superfamily)